MRIKSGNIATLVHLRHMNLKFRTLLFFGLFATLVCKAQDDNPKCIILTDFADPTTTKAVTWQTGGASGKQLLQFAKAIASPYGEDAVSTVSANSEQVSNNTYGLNYYHSVDMTELEPGTKYRYRVGSDSSGWSAWAQFKTADDSQSSKSLEFVYLGDIQNDIYSWGTRAVWAAHSKMPYADFILFAGDCVDKGNDKEQWEEWFDALGRVAETTSVVPVVGNHEYEKINDTAEERALSVYWKAQFSLPKNGLASLEETSFFLDYPAMRLVVLNSMEALASEQYLIAQTEWLERILASTTQKWIVISFHHPLFSARDGRYGDYPELREQWQPLFEKYQVDLVLTGHDHMYGRSGNQPGTSDLEKGEVGPVYVVSVAGPKMYGIDEEKRWMERAAVNTQLYQTISIVGDHLKFRTYTVTDELYDSFDLFKQKEGVNRIEEHLPFDRASELRFPNGKYTNKTN